MMKRVAKLIALSATILSVTFIAASAQHAFNRDDGTFAYPAAADITFTQSGTGAVAQTTDTKLKSVEVNAIDFGVKCNNTNDDTAAINAAIAAVAASWEGKVIFPAGICKTTATITISSPRVSLEGKGQYSTYIISTDGANDVIRFYNASPYFGGAVRNMGIQTSAVSVTSGAGIGIDNVGVITIEDVGIQKTYDGLRLNQGAQGAAEINRVNVSNVVHDSFAIWSTNEMNLNNCTTYQGTAPGNAAFHLINGAGIRITKSNSSLHNYGVLIDPGNSQSVLDVWLSDLDLDASFVAGFQSSPGGTGVARNIFASNVRSGFANNGAFTVGSGVLIGAGTKDITFLGGEIVKNTQYGININGGNSIRFIGVNVQGNSVAGSNSYPGINIAGGDDITFVNGSSTVYPDGLGNSSYQSYGMTIQNAFTGKISVSDVLMTGNVSGEFVNASTAATVSQFSSSTVRALGGFPTVGFWFTASAPKAALEIDISSSATTANTATPALVLTNLDNTTNNLIPLVFADVNSSTKTGIAALMAKTYVRGGGFGAGSLGIYTSTVAGAALAANIDYNQHLTLSGGARVPTIASGDCGATTNGAVVAGSTDQTMQVQIGAAATTTCKITFASVWDVAPRVCLAVPMNAAAAAWGTNGLYQSAITTTYVTFTGAALASTNWGFSCF